MNDIEIITGTVDRFLFQSEENGFSVFLLAQGSKAVTVKGYLPHIQAGQEVQLKGSWVFHAKFGKQFEAQQCTSIVPTTVVGLKKYLGSGLIKGIGPVYAEKLVNYFGSTILDIIDATPERLTEVDGIGTKRIEQIVTAWKDQKEIANLMVFLQEKGITPSLAARIYKKYRSESLAVLLENPYRIADEIWGIGFKTADEMALKLGFQLHAPQRIASGILYVISMATAQGHLYVELHDLKAKTRELLSLTPEHQSVIKDALHALYNRDKIRLITETGEADSLTMSAGSETEDVSSSKEKHYITLTPYYFSEKGVASRIKTLLQRPSEKYFNIDEIYKTLRVQDENEKIQLNEDQQRGILSCLQNKVTIITGGPGTGKTTLIKKLLSLLDKERVRYKLAAPTGRAAKRIIEGTGKYATTIHRLLEYDVASMRFTYNESHALKLDFLIIDEASMIDIFLAHALLKAVPDAAHVVFIGDIDQLPSVGAGNVLNDLIASGIVPCVRLTQIFRQAQDSLIIVNAHKINRGEFPATFLPDARRDFMFIKEEKAEEVENHLKRILFAELPKKGISLDDTIVLTPMNKGIIGTHSLNHSLQGMLNPDSHEKVSYGGTTFKVRDKVMQIRNNYDKNVYNGDIGIVDTINTAEKEMLVNFGDHKQVTYDFEELNELVLAYAISIHKSQGSEYSCVIVPIFLAHFMLLQRNLIYTALTRAKRHCYFIGQTKALAIALRNAKGTKRLTFLKKFLMSSCLALFVSCSAFGVWPFFGSKTAQPSTLPTPLVRPSFTLMIDPSGDARDAGREIEDTFERTLTMQYAQELKKTIEGHLPGVRVILTRFQGETVEPLQNAAFANRINAQLFVSLNFYQTKSKKTQVHLYYLMYNPGTDLWGMKTDDLILLPFDQTYKLSIKKTDGLVKSFYEYLKKDERTVGIHCHTPLGLPFKPLVGIVCPALALEMGIKKKDDWKASMGHIAGSLETLITREIAHGSAA